jgi:hypothetical protein
MNNKKKPRTLQNSGLYSDIGPQIPDHYQNAALVRLKI